MTSAAALVRDGRTRAGITQAELEDVLGVPVDLVPADGLKDSVRQEISADLVEVRAAASGSGWRTCWLPVTPSPST